MRLNLGCGNDYRQGYINVDRVPGVADIVHDLDEFPYPWPDHSVDEILMRHVLEHLQDIRKVMDELWRLLKPGGRLTIYVPHFSNFHALTHPEHRHAFHYNSFQIFTAQSGERYTDRLWNIEEVELGFGNLILRRFFNRHKYIYTTTILAYLFPAYEIKFFMTPLKQ
ncbi:MAG: class I SAM-dependent methyltransferase [Thermoflexales bacterium]